jgi:hypothetical protein
MSIANNIFKQLGAGRFVAMTGAKNLCDTGNGLSVKFPRSNGVNYMKVTLNGKDLYDVEYGYIHGMKFTVKKEVSDLYNDMLQADFTETTGLYTSL